MNNLLRVIETNPVITKVSKRTGNSYELHSVECELIDNTGKVSSKGRLVLPWAYRERFGMPGNGTYAAILSFVVSAGDLFPQVVELVPVEI